MKVLNNYYSTYIYFVSECVLSSFLGCKAKSFWLLTRHGSRNPSDDIITETSRRGPQLRDRVVQNHKQGRGN